MSPPDAPDVPDPLSPRRVRFVLDARVRVVIVLGTPAAVGCPCPACGGRLIVEVGDDHEADAVCEACGSTVGRVIQ